MKNCFEFVVTELRSLIITFGVFAVLDVFDHFKVISDVMTLDHHYSKTNDLSKMMYGATRSPKGYLNLKAPSDLVNMLIDIICNPGSPEEALKINSSLKTLCIRTFNEAGRFYTAMLEGMNRRMLFQKLSQICAPLTEEIKINKEFVIMLINNKLMDMRHLQEISDGVDSETQALRIAHYIIYNVNHIQRLKNFLYIVQNWVRDQNLVEDLEDIVFDIEMCQCLKIQDKIQTDSRRKICELY